MLEQKITLFRLKELLYGKSQKKEAKKRQSRDEDKKNQSDEHDVSKSSSPTIDEDKTSPPQNDKKTDRKKSGRIAEHQYQNAIEHNISHQGLSVGMDCPNACGGNLYNFRPAVRVIIKGNQMGIAHRYTIEKLRCALCNEVFTPELPAELKGEKYDANFITQLALQKYFIGVPCLRQQSYQKLLDFPLPHSTQWMLNEKLASTLIPIFNTLCKLTSNMSLIHIDDTSVKIVDEIFSNRKILIKNEKVCLQRD